MDDDRKKRIRKAKRLLERHPDRVPVMITPDNVKMSVVKFLPHKESTVGEFMCHMRAYTQKLRKSDALLLFVAKTLPSLTEEVGNLYIKHVDSDGYLHMTLSRESTFG